MRGCLLGLGALALAACGNDFEQPSQIERVRVLAIRADPPQLVVPAGNAPPTDVKLTALAVSPASPAVDVRYALCRPFANVYATDFACPGKDGLDLPDGTLSLGDPRVMPFLFGTGGEGGSGLTDPRLAAQLARGFALVIGYEARDGTDGERGVERGVRELTLIATDAPNHNPEIEEITLDGRPVAGEKLPLDRDVSLKPQLAAGSAESLLGPGGPTRESLSYAWAATGQGQVKQYRSREPVDGVGDPTSTYHTPAAPARAMLYVVVRDGRGGESWITRPLGIGD